MSFLRLNKEIYMKLVPFMTIFSSVIGFNVGTLENKIGTYENSPSHGEKYMDKYSNIIGYTSIGIMTGITYPVSYPLFGCYVLYKNRKM